MFGQQVAKLLGMVYYETRNQWRTRSWALILVASLFFAVVYYLVSQNTPTLFNMFDPNFIVDRHFYRGVYDAEAQTFVHQLDHVLKVSDYYAQPPVLSEAQTQQIRATLLIIMVISITMLFKLMALNFMMIDVIPNDRRFGVYELLRSLPLSNAHYLMGKVVSVWWNNLKVSFVILVFTVFLGVITYGVPDVKIVFLYWLLAIVVCTGWVGAIAVLVPVFVKTRRAALLISVMLMPVVLWALSVFWIVLGDMVVLFDPIYRFSSYSRRPYLPDDVLLMEIMQVYGVWAVLLVGVGVGAWLMLRRMGAV